MKAIYFLFKKEIKDYFLSPLVYIIASVFILISGWLFFNYLIASQEPTKLKIVSTVFIPMFGVINMIFMFFAPLITMRSFAEEKKQKTLGLLLMSNCNHWQVIAGKFLSSFVVSLFMISLTLFFPIILYFSGYSDWTFIFLNYLGIIFTVSCYLAVGIFTSSLTENQIVAAILSFCILLGLMVLILSSNATDNYLVAQILSYFSINSHLQPLMRGLIQSYDIVYYLSFIGFFFYLTERSLDSRNW